jgi:cysteinyl-tRNA synthetase
VNAARDASEERTAAGLGAQLRSLGAVLGLLQLPPTHWFRMARPADPHSLSDAQVEERVRARSGARRAKLWAESDRIRDELAAAGVILEDEPGGETRWRRA